MSRKLKGAVIDDDPFTFEMVSDLGNSSSVLEITHKFSSPKTFLDALPSLFCDVYFLDIYMPELSGLEVAPMLGDRPFIFVTGEEQELKAALALNPVDVLTKPLVRGRFNQTVERILQYVEHKDKEHYELFHVASTREMIRLCVNDIMVVLTDKEDGRYKELLMRDGSIYKIAGHNLDSLRAIAPKLVRINIGELVSEDAVESFTPDTIYLKGIIINGYSRTLSLARTYRKDFMKFLKANM